MSVIEKSGNRIVDEMAEMNLVGNVIPNTWFYTFRDEKGNINATALLVLSEIVYWYRPKIERTDYGERYVKKFSADLVQKSYRELCDKFGFSRATMQRHLVYLEEFGVINRVFRTVKSNKDTKLNNVMYISLNVERLKELTYPANVESEKLKYTLDDEVEYTPIVKNDPMVKNDHTLWSNMSTPYGQIRPYPIVKNDHTNTENTNTKIINTENTIHHIGILDDEDKKTKDSFEILEFVDEDNDVILEDDFTDKIKCIGSCKECTSKCKFYKMKLDKQVDLVYELWQEKSKEYGFRSMYKFTTSRKNAMKNRIKDYTLGGVLMAIDKVCASDFLCGKVNDFKVDWDFFCRPNKISEIHEGKYDNRLQERNKPTGRTNTPRKNNMENDLDTLRSWHENMEGGNNGLQ